MRDRWSRGLASVGLVCASGCAFTAVVDEPSTAETETGEEVEPASSPCDDDLAAAWLEVQAPLAPSTRVRLPIAEWATVSDTSELLAAVADGHPYIRLESGVYTAEDPFEGPLQITGQQLWAIDPGGARLEFGVQAGGIDHDAVTHRGSELHGLVFDIHDVQQAAFGADETAAIMAWGDATGLIVEDVVIFGNGLISAGIYVNSADSLQVARVRVRDTSRWGVHAAGPTPTARAALSDLHITDVHGSEGSRWGVGIRLASPADVERVAIREVRFAGILTLGDSTETRIAHVDIDRVGAGDPELGGVGVYFEDTTRATILEQFCIGRNVRIGVNSEWDHLDDPELAHPRGIDNVVRYGVSDAWYVGVHFDQGTVNGEVHDVVFRNYERAGIVFCHNVSEERLWPNYDDGSREHDNVFEQPQVDCEVCDVSYTVWNSVGPLECVGSTEPCERERKTP